MNDNKRMFWKNATPELQERNFNIFINLVKELKENSYYLFMLFSQTDKNVLKRHNKELVELMLQNKENMLIVQNIWKSLNVEYQKKYVNIIKIIINELLIQDKDISEIWKVTNGEAQFEILDELLDKYSDIGKSNNIFKGLNIPLSKNRFELFLEKNGVSVNSIDSTYEAYQSIFKINKNVNETIDLNIFNDKIFNIFDIEKMAKITTYPELQRKIVKLSKIQGFEVFIETINHDNWEMELDIVLKNIDNYTKLLKNISNEAIDEKIAQILAQVISQKDNYFNIINISDLQNYFEIKKDVCQKILNNEEDERLSQSLQKYSDEDKKRFAILEMIYGIDIEEARNLVEKYGKDIEKIDVNKYKRNVIALIGIKRILECENISEEYKENKSIINNELEKIQYTTIAELETSCINMYTELYKETLYTTQENDKIEEIEYEGTKINVYEVKEEFNMFVRVEGACNGYKEPEDFNKELSTVNTKYHGNCRSFIGQDSISIAYSEGVKFGYCISENRKILLSAPWDIVSNGANKEFSIASVKFDINNGIQFRTPEEMINNTRHPYNEFDFEQLGYEEECQEFQVDKPEYIVYVKEPNVDRELDDKWRVSKKAARQLKLPIVIIDREKIVMREWEKVQKLQDILLGKSDNINNISEADLIKNIIIKFENNVNSVRASELLKNKYFNYEQRKAMIINIVDYIKSLENVNFDKYKELFNKFMYVVEDETDKCISNTGQQVAKYKYGQSFLNVLKQKCSKIEEESKKQYLKNAYQQVGIEINDLRDAKRFLENEKNKEREQKLNIRGV